MGRLHKVKRILDSVHGQIKIPKEWCEKIIDTPHFQRLRRIEQNSCRSVFPSARHDRFIHSLGVYHIGDMIASHIEDECDVLPENYSQILKTYRLACLLHDVGHTPFSHTFEIFFNEREIRNALDSKLHDEAFSNDLLARTGKLTEHELLSALVAFSVFQEKFHDDPEINWVLIVRMIIGLPYLNGNDLRDSTRFENIMIDLIHGIIDADGLDYVCRDAWAGGYHNFSIDLQRLIESIDITRNENNYHLAFSSKALNEIEGVLNVKNFQFLYVINHHKVHLEQHYLIEAMKTAAAYHLDIPNKDEALEKICTFNLFFEGIELEKSHYKLYRPCDDDFIAMMKQAQIEKDIYIDGWFSRQYIHKPLWKSKIHFFQIFSDVLFDLKVPVEDQRQNNADSYLKRKRNQRIDAICEEKCKQVLREKLGLEDGDIFQVTINPKIRRISPDEIYVTINDIPRKFSELAHDCFSVISEPSKFCFWYVNLDKIEGDNEIQKRKLVIDEIKKFVAEI